MARFANAAGALVAIGVSAVLLWPSGSGSSAIGPIELLGAKGNIRIVNSKAARAIFTARNVTPGKRIRGGVYLRNRGPHDVRLRLTAKRIRDVRGEGGGRLSRAMKIRIARRRPMTAPKTTVFRGRLPKLRRAPVGRVPAGRRRFFRFWAKARPPGEANRYMGAEVRFRLVWLVREE